MASSSPRDAGMSPSETLEAFRSLQQSLSHTDSRLQKVEEARKFFGETQENR
jgi:hypothetical protein